ncbi:hypothetical protein F5Y04DRAFT_242558 [Hypomontagnella monticulosa]|nr:hypothetical protein F5Y04DRAFT_242558 [Hypomontagnella monticulosa]
MLVTTLPIPQPLLLTAEPLTPAAFSPFGAVLTNPAPDIRPSAVTPQNISQTLPPATGAVSANQGSAIQYRALAPPLRNLYAQAPSRKPAEPRTTMFVCGARELAPDPDPGLQVHRRGKGKGKGRGKGPADSRDGGLFQVSILERHPFTTQTFVPVGAGAEARYLVIVAPSLAPDQSTIPSDVDEKNLCAPMGPGLPGRGLPDLTRVRAFVATGAQAVTYGAGTWHAPMAALGPAGSAIDFVVVQFANDEPVEDCQEVALEGSSNGGAIKGEEADSVRIMVRVPPSRIRHSKL